MKSRKYRKQLLTDDIWGAEELDVQELITFAQKGFGV